MDNNIDKKNIQLLISIIKNSIPLALVKIGIPLFYFIITFLIARFLGARGLGIFTIIFSYYGIFKSISVFGKDWFLIREVHKDKEKAEFYLGNTFLLGICFSILAIFLMNFCLYINNYSSLIRISGLILSLALLPDSFIMYTEAVFISFRKNVYILFTVYAKEILFVVFATVFLLIYKSIIPIIIIRYATIIFGFWLNLKIVNKYFLKQRLIFDVEIFRNILKTSSIMGLSGIISLVFLNTDVIILSKIRGEIDVGLYSAAYKFVNIIAYFVDSIAINLVPPLTRLYKESLSDFKIILRNILRYFMVVNILITIVIFFFSKELILLIFGKQFIASSFILNILIWSTFFQGISLILSKTLFTMNMQSYDLFVYFIACIANFLLSISFTLRWGYIGTAIATLISYAVLFFMHLYIFYHKIFKQDIKLNLGKATNLI